MNYIFFDVDGVLNGTDKNGVWIDEEIQIDKVNQLIELAKTTNAKLVMSSTWRTAWDKNGKLIKRRKETILLDELLKKAGCELHSITPVLDYDRNKEIKLWLKENTQAIDKFICLDDEYGYYTDDDFYKEKFVHTAPPHCNGAYGNGDVVGLFEKHVAEAKEMLLKQTDF